MAEATCKGGELTWDVGRSRAQISSSWYVGTV